MKRIGVLVLALAAGVAGLKLALRKEPRSAEAKPPEALPKTEWGHVDWMGFRLWLPRGWEHDRSLANGEIFSGPFDDGFKPNVHLYWTRTRRTFDQWCRLHRGKHDGGDAIIRSEGTDQIAGMSARWLIYQTTTRWKGKDVVTMTKDWYFCGEGHGGILRCVSGGRTFLQPYHALFNEIKRRLEHKSG